MNNNIKSEFAAAGAAGSATDRKLGFMAAGALVLSSFVLSCPVLAIDDGDNYTYCLESKGFASIS